MQTVPFSQLVAEVETAVMTAAVTDIHTHLYDPAFDRLLLWGIDDLLTYHYLVAEVVRYLDVPYEAFWRLSKMGQAELVWQTLFVDHSPVSEACRGVITTLNLLGLDVKQRDLPALRRWFADQTPAAHVDRCLDLAGVARIFMTNSPFDDLERPAWETGFRRDPRFLSGLRIDPLLLSWKEVWPRLSKWGYRVRSSTLSQKHCDEARRFLADWTRRMEARYLMVSLPPEFTFPANTDAARLLERVVLPHCRDHGLPLALMSGVKRAVNPQLRLAGDGVGCARLETLQNLCAGFPENKFMATVLARENQHELCVLARKFRNLHVFGCWWFTNIPSQIAEITRMRVELLGLSFTPQHSDARVLDQIIYKWRHSRKVMAGVLANEYRQLAESGWQVTAAELRRDVAQLFGGGFDQFCGR